MMGARKRGATALFKFRCCTPEQGVVKHGQLTEVRGLGCREVALHIHVTTARQL